MKLGIANQVGSNRAGVLRQDQVLGHKPSNGEEVGSMRDLADISHSDDPRLFGRWSPMVATAAATLGGALGWNSAIKDGLVAAASVGALSAVCGVAAIGAVALMIESPQRSN